MQRFIQKITQQLIDRLPDNDQYYRLYELRSWEFPSFIIRRIKIELERNLAESMIIPKTDWANTRSDAVLDAWQQFVDAIRAEARLPASYAQTVIETAVADVVEMLVQPRKNIPEVIFGNEDELDAEAIRDRVQAVVVYPQFAKLIPRYMEKKELDVLTKQRCKTIVKSADDKLTKKYSPLNWAQMMEPLFRLSDAGIDTNLLRLFFEDRNMPRVARQFDLMEKNLTRAALIEVLSSPDLLSVDDDDEQSNLFGDQPSSVANSDIVEAEQSESKQNKEQDISDEVSGAPFDLEDTELAREDASVDQKESSSVEEDSADSLNTGFVEEADDDEAPEEENQRGAKVEDDDSLNALFSESEEDTDEVKKPVDNDKQNGQNDESEENPRPDEEIVQDNIEEPDAKDPINEKQDTGDEVNNQVSDNKQGESQENDEETPMWMRYMSDEEIEEYKKKQEEGEDDDDGFIEEPIIDLTNEDASDKEIDKLRSELSDDRDRFVEEIFGGSDRAYDEAVEDIAVYDSWRDVSKYIEKDVFKRNMVDMYSEPAVDFTDRLQSYFLKKENRNE